MKRLVSIVAIFLILFNISPINTIYAADLNAGTFSINNFSNSVNVTP
jgi:hypothetical protein